MNGVACSMIDLFTLSFCRHPAATYACTKSVICMGGGAGGGAGPLSLGMRPRRSLLAVGLADGVARQEGGRSHLRCGRGRMRR